MDAHDWNRRTWVMTLRRFMELAWTRHGATRYASVLALPAIVALTTPGPWGLCCALGALLGILLDLRVHSRLQVVGAALEQMSEQQLRQTAQHHIWAVSAITGAYCIPYAAMAFSEGVGPLIGLVYCAGSAVVITSLHVMTRTMIFYTVPSAALGLIANAAVVAPEGYELVAVVLAATVVINVLVMARAGGISFGDLIAARLAAELAAEDLEKRVEERTSELVEAMHVAEAANKAKSVFLANMSHELRTPLNAVIGYSEIIEEDLGAGDSSECAHHISRVRASALHLLGLIADVLDLAKVEADKVALRPEQFSTRELARAVLDIVAPAAAENRTRCDLVVDPGAEQLTADPLRVRQCLMNLASNAAKFTHEGRVLIHIKRVRGKEGEAIAFEVADTGIGIDQETLTRLFQPFAQADASITRRYGGTGLGLSITRKYARLMGGDVSVESAPGEGSRFTLWVPIAAPMVRADPHGVAA